MLNKREQILFSNVSYLIQISHSILNGLPPFLRNPIFRMMLGSMGKETFVDYGVYFRYPKKIYVGNGCEINRNCEFYPSFKFKDSIIQLGNNVILGPNVVFYGAGQMSSLNRDDISESIIIEDNVYIGGNSVIRYGVRIGKGSTVAANSTVVKNVEPMATVGGSPARPLKKSAN